MKKHNIPFFLYVPTSFLAFMLMFLLVHNGLVVFYVHPPVSTNSFPPETTRDASEQIPLKYIEPLDMVARKKIRSALSSLARNSTVVSYESRAHFKARILRRKKIVGRALRLLPTSKHFSTRVSVFLRRYNCRARFFMTWLSALDAFGSREVFALEGLFKSHPIACLIIVSSSMDSDKGKHILNPFLDKGYRVMACKPDFDYLFENTPADSWFKKFKKGKINPGMVPLGQNLSNLLRLALLYKFGGIYLDTDVLVLKSLHHLRNAVGAQTMDLETGLWSRLNNAVLIFDKNHPLLLKFIREFALTFDGNKWGHNGPYLVSRVVSRFLGKPELDNVTVLPPSAFYPVNWSRVQSIFKRPTSELHSKRQEKMLKQIKDKSFAIHFWNKHSKNIEIEGGSIVDRIMLEYCLLCSSANSTLISE